MAEKKKPLHYVNNKEFYAAMVKYKAACNLAAEEGREQPRIPNYLGECIYKIAMRLANRPNFIHLRSVRGGSRFKSYAPSPCWARQRGTPRRHGWRASCMPRPGIGLLWPLESGREPSGLWLGLVAGGPGLGA